MTEWTREQKLSRKAGVGADRIGCLGDVKAESLIAKEQK
jgi:hypothetical protein